ncbi:YolD-like family protein [Bacillus sp. FSL K6-1284]|uniref:YolD-like family protein n=1 Tax=Bacillus sp. FSL K6-1284 TaxID=2921468 RepID=UPI002DBC9270|nr:YolD-like family protein [Bacillus haynesii]
MTLRDRGTMKWTSIFLPEHIAQLRRLKSEIDHAYERKPAIDPEQWSDFESKIQYAYRTGQACEIRYWRNWVAEAVSGVIDSVDPVGGALRIDGVDIPFKEIVWVALEDV